MKNYKYRSVFSKSLRLTSLLVILRNDFQSRVLNIEYHTKFIQVHKFLSPEKSGGPLSQASAFQPFILHKTMTKQCSFCIKQWLSNPEPFRIESLNLYGHVVRYISFYIKWMVPFLKRCILQMTNIITKKGWLSDWSDQTCLLFRLQHLYSGIWVPAGCTILYQPCPNQSGATEWCWWWSAIRLQSTATYIQTQGMGCEGAWAHAQVRCAVARVRAKSFLKSVCDVRAARFRVCDVRSHFCTLFASKRPEKIILCLN